MLGKTPSLLTNGCLCGKDGNTSSIRDQNRCERNACLAFRDRLPRMVASWLRNYIATLAVYFGVSGAWAYYIYWCFGLQLFGSSTQMPTAKDVSDQIKVQTLLRVLSSQSSEPIADPNHMTLVKHKFLPTRLR